MNTIFPAFIVDSAPASLSLPGAIRANSASTAARRGPPSRITGSPEPPRPYVTERVFPSLVFDQPVELVAIPGTNRLAVLEVAGKIYSFENRPEAETLPNRPVRRHRDAAIRNFTPAVWPGVSSAVRREPLLLHLLRPEGPACRTARASRGSR